MDRSAFDQAIKKGECKGVYLLEGVEENMKATSLQALRKAILPEGMEELNEALLENPPTSALVAAAETLPFLADKRLVIVREHAGLLRGEADERLIDYLAHVPPTAIVVFVHRGKADARKKLYKAIAKHGQVVSFGTLSDAELNAWICKAFSAQEKECPPSVASLLAFTSGSDTALLRTEIDKLVHYTGDRRQITDEDVRAIATRSIEYTVFNMVDAVVAGQEGRAFSLLRDMLVSGEERLGILAMLLRQYRMLQHVKIMQYEKRTPQQMQQDLGVKGFVLDRYLRQARSLTGSQVKRAVEICMNMEYLVKSGQRNQEGSLEAAMLELFALKKA